MLQNNADRHWLNQIADQYGTPCYVYFWDDIVAQVDSLRAAFGDRFQISYAMKANPNDQLCARICEVVDFFDVSSGGELDLALQIGCPPGRISFSGPGKRREELEQAVDRDCGLIIAESVRELTQLNELAMAAGKRVNILLRINPARSPRKFALSMSRGGSQFGIDEEQIGSVLGRLPEWPQLDFQGFHIYAATNSLDEAALADNFSIYCELFARFTDAHDLRPRYLVFGAGFGIPYEAGVEPLNLRRLAGQINPMVDQLRARPHLSQTSLLLEMGRFVVGPAGYFLTSVVGRKSSRGAEIAICDGGMNNHLSACNLMGTLIPRNWPMAKVDASPHEPRAVYRLVGPLCTSIDTLGHDVELPQLEVGSRIAIGSSGAYGLTASPIRFIRHPEPREFLVSDSGVTEITVHHSCSLA
jgi:diaminopimelate decarboxylase